MGERQSDSGSRSQLVEHVRFFAELGVKGLNQSEILVPLGVSSNTEQVPQSSPTTIALSGRGVGSTKSLQSIRNELGECTRCKLHELGRQQIVFGVGDPKARLMFVGEAPGRDEDAQGVPFVGRAGKLLTKIIESIGLDREQVYIANVIKCRPPKNRNPEHDEVEKCEPFLFTQIDSVRPLVIVALGSFAARTLLQSETTISRLRGQVYDYRGTQLIPTFHPAYLLRNPGRKRDVWEDMKRVKALLLERDSVD